MGDVRRNSYIMRGGSRKRKSRTRRKLMKYDFMAFSACLVLTVVFGVATLIASATTKAKPADLNYRFADDVIINDMDVSGQTYAQVYETVANNTNAELVTMAITVRDGDDTLVITASDIGLNCDLSSFLGTVVSGKNANGGHTEYTVDENKLLATIKTAAGIFDCVAMEPYAVADEFSDTPSFKYYEGEDGKELDQIKLYDEIIKCVQEKKLICTITPEFLTVKPIKTIDDVKQNTVLRSTFSTSYGDSSSLRTEPRKHNIFKTSRKLNACEIEVGVLWSFNEFIGPRTYDGGWEPAPGIVNGSSYEMQAGGGICQVSTTLHNALMLAGPEIEFKERKNHSWPSSYVEYGLDATVSTGGPDLKFINNTKYPIYVFAYADHSTYTMTIYIYGEPLPNGITYNVYAEIEQELVPGDTKIVEEPTWDKGRTEITVKERIGYITNAYRETLENGVVIKTDKLYTYTYRAVQGEKHVGTGG